MTNAEYLLECKAIILQYEEGLIDEKDAIQRIIFWGVRVLETDPNLDPAISGMEAHG